MNEMKVCPFCGNEPAIDRIEKRIYCVGCGCSFCGDVFAQMKDLVKQWNSRPNPVIRGK